MEGKQLFNSGCIQQNRQLHSVEEHLSWPQGGWNVLFKNDAKVLARVWSGYFAVRQFQAWPSDSRVLTRLQCASLQFCHNQQQNAGSCMSVKLKRLTSTGAHLTTMPIPSSAFSCPPVKCHWLLACQHVSLHTDRHAQEISFIITLSESGWANISFSMNPVNM